MTKIDGGICAAKGFKASGTYCGIKKPAVENPNPDYVHKNDICLVACDVLCNTAAVYTQNKVKGAPILVTKDHLAKSGNKAKAIIANSKNANTCNADGVEKAAKMCQLVADEMGLPAEQVLVASTGVIGQVLPIEPIITAVPTLVKELDYGKNEEAATAIMTTDTVKKEYAVEFQLDGKTCRLGGMAKGSGMIHPNMATMLLFITTDANGYKLIAAFDVAQNEVGKEINGIQIRHVDELEVFCAEHHPKVAVLCVPRDGAEQVSGRLVDLGIEGFWNFSHYDLSVPYPDVVVENVHLGDSLMSLGYRLRNQE